MTTVTTCRTWWLALCWAGSSLWSSLQTSFQTPGTPGHHSTRKPGRRTTRGSKDPPGCIYSQTTTSSVTRRSGNGNLKMLRDSRSIKAYLEWSLLWFSFRVKFVLLQAIHSYTTNRTLLVKNNKAGTYYSMLFVYWIWDQWRDFPKKYVKWLKFANGR